MPLPRPQSGENRAEFVSRCTSDDAVQNESVDRDQALAICISIWDERNMSPNEKLLAAIKSRGDSKPDPFGYGILTADRYTKSMLDCVGIDACYKFAATKTCSFDDVMRKAANTLVYSNEDMTGSDVLYGKKPNATLRLLDIGDTQIELPKNTLLAFRHILTSPLKDRDGDILRTQGAIVDPHLPLLWQHVHTLPIGKSLRTIEHTRDVLSMISAIVDTNELSHDAAVLIDNDVLRFSHGFRALNFEEMRTEAGEFNGFDIKDFEIMEASVVSVPSNTDARVQEIMLSLGEGGKLTSPLMKATVKSMRAQMPVSVTVALPNAWEVTSKIGEAANADKSGNEQGAKEGACSCASKEADAAEIEAKTIEAEPTEVKERIALLKEMLDRGAFTEDELTVIIPAKSGRALSKANAEKLKDVIADIESLSESEVLMTRSGHALCERCSGMLNSIVDSAAPDEEVSHIPSVKEAMAVIFTATNDERKHVLDALAAMEKTADDNRQVENYRALIGAS